MTPAATLPREARVHDPVRLAPLVVSEYARVMADWGYTDPPAVGLADARRVLARHGITRKEGAAART